MNILLIPDTQVKPTTDMKFLYAIGKEIVEKKPDVIVHIGDHWDMPSVSTYLNQKQAEGQRVKEDIHAGHLGMQQLLEPLRRLQEQQRSQRKKVYRPRMVFTMGNHEERLERFVGNNPVLEGVDDFDLKHQIEGYGWETYPFKEPVVIGGVAFCHYFYNPMSGRPYGGQCANKLNHVGTSFCMGHQQGFQFAEKIIPTGGRIMGMVAGSSYLDEEEYIGPQANHHWRGIVHMTDVKDGVYNFERIDTETLVNKYF
ncbi:metallo-phosphoesterase [Vibrio phage Vp_R1]|uniref:Calcineurin-like phosphoesterase domain-containing protein n=1 Tax=Vibrio phage Vp_R1 TaxID=2059867 RepID=A0A2H5BQ83_9CAUD|nr:metallo-phosphoesterase [Vibrio phage Vp_R1]AUG88499.1 hypothetical protein VPR_135 [Vibrio phage Vp_R1]